MHRQPAIGILGIGEMGASLGRQLTAAGYSVFADLAGRSDESLARAAEARLTPVASGQELIARSDILLSVLPPDQAQSAAAAVASCLEDVAGELTFVEANAISPASTHDISTLFVTRGVRFIDGGIVGGPPNSDYVPRLYVSGPDCSRLDAIDGLAFEIRRLPGGIGQASAFKMTYAALTKGTNTLFANVALCAESFGFLDMLLAEFDASQKSLRDRAEASIPSMPCDAARWVREMEEIRDTFVAQGLPGGFHQGAAEIMKILEDSRFGTETRRSRCLARARRHRPRDSPGPQARHLSLSRAGMCPPYRFLPGHPWPAQRFTAAPFRTEALTHAAPERNSRWSRKLVQRIPDQARREGVLAILARIVVCRCGSTVGFAVPPSGSPQMISTVPPRSTSAAFTMPMENQPPAPIVYAAYTESPTCRFPITTLSSGQEA